MKQRHILGETVYRIPPVPKYDFSGMECWLEDLAKEGLLLRKDGFFAGIASFDCQEPQTVKYRLEAAQKKGGILSEDGGEPSDEQIELGEKYNWDYLTRWGEFHIYRSGDSAARELNTDAEVQAIALNAVKKRQRGWLFYSVFWLILYPLLRTKGCLLSLAIGVGSGGMLVGLFLTLLWVADDIQAFAHLKRVQKALRNEGDYPDSPDWRKRAVPYFARKIVKLLLVVLLIAVLGRTLGGQLSKEGKIPLDDYGGTLPFATLRELSGGTHYRRDGMLGLSVNCVEEKTDWLAHSISYNECANYTGTDGKSGGGGLYVDYFELRNETLAKLLFREICRLDRRKNRAEPMSAPELRADEAAAYRSELHFPTLVFRRGNTVVRAYFYQVGESGKIPTETWMNAICESVA